MHLEMLQLTQIHAPGAAVLEAEGVLARLALALPAPLDARLLQKKLEPEVLELALPIHVLDDHALGLVHARVHHQVVELVEPRLELQPLAAYRALRRLRRGGLLQRAARGGGAVAHVGQGGDGVRHPQRHAHPQVGEVRGLEVDGELGHGVRHCAADGAVVHLGQHPRVALHLHREDEPRAGVEGAVGALDGRHRVARHGRHARDPRHQALVQVGEGFVVKFPVQGHRARVVQREREPLRGLVHAVEVEVLVQRREEADGSRGGDHHARLHVVAHLHRGRGGDALGRRRRRVHHVRVHALRHAALLDGGLEQRHARLHPRRVPLGGQVGHQVEGVAALRVEGAKVAALVGDVRRVQVAGAAVGERLGEVAEGAALVKRVLRRLRERPLLRVAHRELAGALALVRPDVPQPLGDGVALHQLGALLAEPHRANRAALPENEHAGDVREGGAVVVQLRVDEIGHHVVQILVHRSDVPNIGQLGIPVLLQCHLGDEVLALAWLGGKHHEGEHDYEAAVYQAFAQLRVLQKVLPEAFESRLRFPDLIERILHTILNTIHDCTAASSRSSRVFTIVIPLLLLSRLGHNVRRSNSSMSAQFTVPVGQVR
mmetsp:Transcript_44403/g.84923  ORF Transcript_44403/g.84923 Transcript_44403/m.84923 type:complete len:602 (-) Transcript_44403:31-1836(-)